MLLLLLLSLFFFRFSFLFLFFVSLFVCFFLVQSDFWFRSYGRVPKSRMHFILIHIHFCVKTLTVRYFANLLKFVLINLYWQKYIQAQEYNKQASTKDCTQKPRSCTMVIRKGDHDSVQG